MTTPIQTPAGLQTAALAMLKEKGYTNPNDNQIADARRQIANSNNYDAIIAKYGKNGGKGVSH